MVDEYGNVVTDKKGIENIVIKRFEERLTPLSMREDLDMHKVQREDCAVKKRHGKTKHQIGHQRILNVCSSSSKMISLKTSLIYQMNYSSQKRWY